MRDRIWKGDILVADIQELERMHASEMHARRLNSKEVITPQSGEKFIFSIADGKVKLSEGDEDLRTSTFMRDYPGRGEDRKDDLRGESDGSPPQDSLPCDREARHDFWSISGNYISRHHVSVERRVIPNSTTIYSRGQDCKHDLGCNS